MTDSNQDGSTQVEVKTTVETQGQPPQDSAELAWHSGRVLLAVGLAVLIVWWRLRNGGELSEAVDSGLALFNDVAMGGSLLAVAALVARTWKGAKPLTVDPRKAAPRPQPPIVTETVETTTTTTTNPTQEPPK